MFLAEIQTKDRDGRTKHRQSYSWDGKEDWQLKYAGDPKIRLPNVTIHSGVRVRYDNEIFARRYLLLSVLPREESSAGSYNLADMLRQGEPEFLTDEEVLQSRCLPIAFHGRLSKMETNSTVWIAPAKQYVALRYRNQSRAPGESQWHLMEEWNATTLAVTEVKTSGGTRRVWYPSHISRSVFDRKGNPLFTGECRITSLTLNKPPPSAAFTPKLEAGASVMDFKKGRSFVYGGGLSRRLRAVMTEKVNESRKALASSKPMQVDGTASPPHSYYERLSWIAVVVGCIGLLFAAYLAVKGRRSPAHPSPKDH
ncbi:MAG: hypothetical protein ACP5XB_07050 [Isosphaeraceae bacterium]